MVGKQQTAMIAVAVPGILAWGRRKVSRSLAAMAAVLAGGAQEVGECRTSPMAKPGPLDRYDRYRGMVAQVFISRPIATDPAADEFASKLRNKLEGKDIVVFPGKAPSGSRHAEYFENGASLSEVFVAILTPEYFKRYFTMHELDIALAAQDDSREQIKLIPIDLKPGGLKHEDFIVKDSWVDSWSMLARDYTSDGFKVDVDRWKKNLDRLKTITRETVYLGDLADEAFLERCSESIIQAMQPDPFVSRFDVFIAHTGQQKDFAIQLQDTLRQLGLHAFVDKPDLAPGSGNADDKIRHALQTAHIGVAVLSNAFLEKKYPMRELEFICGKDNLMPIFFDITYEEMEKQVRLSEQEELENKVLRTTAHLNVEDKEFSTILCQRVAFSVLRELATKKCSIGGVTSQAAFTFVERIHTMLKKVVNKPGCLPYILKKDMVEAADLLESTRAVLTHQRLSKMYFLRGIA